MNPYMVLFLVVCVALGLWQPPRARWARTVGVLTAGLVLFFLFLPARL
jgi:hypothetical protein